MEWLKCGERSWEDVVKALSSPIVGFSDIARTIEKDYVYSLSQRVSTKIKKGIYKCMRRHASIDLDASKTKCSGRRLCVACSTSGLTNLLLTVTLETMTDACTYVI